MKDDIAGGERSNIGTMKQRLASLCAGILFFAASATSTHATIITADPDAFAAGTNISNAFSGVTLAAISAGFGSGPSIFAVNPSTQPVEPFNASTGSLVFGTNSALFPHLFREPGFLSLRANFAAPTNFVSIDFISNDGSDVGFLRAFDSLDNLIGTFTTAALAANQFAAMTVFSGTSNIAYILAGGLDGQSSGGLDNLRFDVQASVPEPSTILLMLMGFVALVGTQFRRIGKYPKP